MDSFFQTHDDAHHVHISIILIDEFSLLALSSFTALLQHANEILGQNIYSWALLSKKASAVTSSCGCQILVKYIMNDDETPINMMIFSKDDNNDVTSRDIALQDIKSRFGDDLTKLVANKFTHSQDTPTTPSAIYNPKLAQAITEMENSSPTILSRNEIARRAGLSQRQLERLFQRYLNTSPARYYLKMRLKRAKNLLTQTPMPITEIALNCGFVSASHFSKCYRELFTISPRAERLKNAPQTSKNQYKQTHHHILEKEIAE